MPPKKSKKEEPESCSICLDNYTSILRRKAVCKYCKKDACSKCIERYLLERIEDAHCLHCRVNYDDDSLQEICTKTYLQNKYFKHRQEVLVNRERARLPGLQDQAVLERRKRDGQKQLNVLRGEWTELERKRDTALIEYNHAYTNFTVAKHNGAPEEERNRLREILLAKTNASEELRKELAKKRDEYYVLYSKVMRGDGNELGTEDEIATAGSAAAGSQEAEKKKFIRRCTRDNCQGFLSTAWKCGICEYYSCNKCFKERGKKQDDPHECKKEDLETAELIRKDSKPCPNCGEFITKSEGCDQMFCVSCQTPFSWNTGKIITTGAIHNPHYYEWLKRNGQNLPRNPADVPCGGYPNAWQLRRFPRDFPKDLEQQFMEYHRLCIEVQDTSTRNWQTHLNQDLANRTNINFLIGEYDEKRWGQLLAQQEKKRKRDGEVQDIFGAFRMIAVELINRFQNYHDPTYGRNPPTPVLVDLIRQILMEFHGLIDMINDAFKKSSLRHKYSVPFLYITTSVHLHHANRRRFFEVRTKNYYMEAKQKRDTPITNTITTCSTSMDQLPVAVEEMLRTIVQERDDDSDDSDDPDTSDSESDSDEDLQTRSEPSDQEDTSLQMAIVESLRIH
jgi:hypothetical protein